MLDLPVEVIIQVFSQLGHRDLLTCTLVCRLFHTVVQENASCQYTIELAVAGMQDGPPSALGHADRLTMLRNSQAAWQTLRWTGVKDVSMLQGSLYELYGGVLAQSNQLGGRGLVFRRLPSHYRGIEEHVWSLELDIHPRDFTMDPAQDLLVLVAQPILQPGMHDARIETSIHLRSLTTGEGHPLAKLPVLVHDVDLRTANLTFMLQVHGERVAVHFVSHGIAPSDLVVWNWKTGEILLNTYSAHLMAFGFLTERLILVGGVGEVSFNVGQPRLVVVDLDANRERVQFEQAAYRCAFLYPAWYPWVHVLSFLIRSDPCTGWRPGGGVGVPFSIGSGPRLYVVTIWVMRGEEVTPVDLFVLSSTLLEYVDMDGAGGRDVGWAEWGGGTRMMAQAPHSHAWVCYVFGTRFSSVCGGEGEETVEVWDFNPLAVKRAKRRCGASVLRGVFVDDVRTGLPYRVVRRRLPEPVGGFREAMCSEDGLILVDVGRRQFRMLSF